MLTTLDHIGLLVNDLSAATRSYAMLLGRSPTWRGRASSAGTENTIFRLENTCIELIAPSSSVAPESSEGIGFLAFGTEDVVAAGAQCRACGLDASEPRDELSQDTDSGAFRRSRTVALPPVQTGGIRMLLVEQRSPEALLPYAPPTGAVAASVRALDHVVVMTGAPERAIALYRDQLGLRLALDRSFERRGVRLLFFRIGGATVEVGSSLAERTEASGEDRLWGAAYRVDDVAAAHARLVDAGVAVSETRVGNKPGTRVFTIKGETHGVPTLIIGDG